MLWNADVTPCLQNLSDTAVMVHTHDEALTADGNDQKPNRTRTSLLSQATYKLRNVSAPVPEWVLKVATTTQHIDRTLAHTMI